MLNAAAASWLVLAVIGAMILVAYIATGSYVRYRGGIRRCPDMLPHYAFVCKVASGVKLVFLRIVTCGSYRPPVKLGAQLPEEERHAFAHLPGDDEDPEDDEFDEALQELPASMA